MEYELFKKQFEFKGKHARMASELWISNDAKNSYFTRLIDLYITAAVIGFRSGRKAGVDTSTSDTNSVFAEQMIKAKEDLEFILQMMLLIEGNESDDSECINKAFKNIQNLQTKEEYDHYNTYFNDYVRGGVERLYELLIQRPKDDEDEFDLKSSNVVALLEKYS